ncbi:MAG: hypothetical protein U0R17_00420 [Acidimicrobiia bacterium]
MSNVSDISKMITELIDLIINYVKQQTIMPLKRLGRYLAFGFIGSIFISFGLFMLSVGFLRYLQTLSPFESTYSFAPYLLVIVADAIVVAVFFAIASNPSLIKERKSRK